MAIGKKAEALLDVRQAGIGISAGVANYRKTFFAANPTLEGKVWVHHAVEQQVLTRYPGAFSKQELGELVNLRGIPNSINSEIHLSKLRIEWNVFYRSNPNATKAEILGNASILDQKYGRFFNPPQ